MKKNPRSWQKKSRRQALGNWIILSKQTTDAWRRSKKQIQTQWLLEESSDWILPPVVKILDVLYLHRCFDESFISPKLLA